VGRIGRLLGARGPYGEDGVARPADSPKREGAKLEVVGGRRGLPASPASDAGERFRQLVDGIRDYAIFMLDREGHILSWNTGAERIYGYRPEEIIGRHFSSLYTVDDLEAGKPERVLQKAAEVGRVEDEGWRVRKDGTRYWAHVGTSPLRGPGGRISGFAKVTHDITEKRLVEGQVREAQRALRELIDSMGTFCAKVALDGRLLLVNRTAEQASGLPREELMRTNFLEGQWWTFDPDVAHRVRQAFERACAGETVSYDEEIFAFGRVLTISFSLVPVQDDSGEVRYVVAEGRDVTARREAEEALRDRTAELEAANRDLEAFSYSVSHDLRAPLRAVNGYAKILIDDHGPGLSDEARGHLERIRASSENLGTLIEGLLDFSRLGRQKLERATVSPVEVVREALAELAAEQEGRKVEIRIGDLPSCHADRGLLKRVFVNLLSNALKYTRARKAALIEVGFRPVGGERDRAAYFVRDNGVGFDARYSDRLFDVFERLHPAEEYEGTGVGLAIVQRIIHRHDGRVWAESVPDRGATFYFNFGGSSTDA
jgi:PAS domain S-box-containing protein